MTAKWPFTIYHSPIEREFRRRLEMANVEKGGRLDALNVGCGWFAGYPDVQELAKRSACDLDPRCVSHVKARFPKVDAFTCEPIPSLPESRFDVVISKEVIEHVIDSESWIKALVRSLKPGGLLLISTPNYGISLLPLVEYTLLEIIARRQGFSRFDIHPNKFDFPKLARAMKAASPSGSVIEISRISWGMVLFASVRIPG